MTVLPETNIQLELKGELALFSEKLIQQWLLPASEANPAMLQMLRDRNQKPERKLLPWSGEFIGKHLTSCVEVYHVTHNDKLRLEIESLIKEVLEIQEENGYIGPWASEDELTGNAPNSHWEFDFMEKGLTPVPDWDTWDFYHLMMGMVCWYMEVQDERVLSSACKMADLLCNEFGRGCRRLSEIGTTETNLAPVHGLCLLYACTKKQEYLNLAEQLVDEFSAENAGNYYELALQGKDFYEMPIPRWESLHLIMGLASLYEITGKESYGEAFRHLWWSMVKTDRHNTGGFTSGESACGNPYDERAIETCCTVAWMALSIEMLKMTGNSIIADELELSFLNGGLGAISPSGRWCTYNTPMDGYKFSSMRDIVFQSRPGSPELNCCSVNAPRILGMLGQWAVMNHDGKILINYYGSYNASVKIGRDNIQFKMSGDYLANGKVQIAVETEKEVQATLCIRIPNWSKETKIFLNQTEVKGKSGSYQEIQRNWKNGDLIEIAFDMSLYYWRGEKEKEGLSSIYRGPLLLTYDCAYNKGERDCLSFDAKNMKAEVVKQNQDLFPVFVECKNEEGEDIIFCDFRSAGYLGREYNTWLKVKNVEKRPFSQENPLRADRP